MTYEHTLVCLANSIKHHPSRCIAGKSWNGRRFQDWIRPVTNDAANEGAVPPSLSILQDNTQPSLLDVVTVQFVRPVPHGCQTENHLIASSAWKKMGKVTWEQLESIIESPANLWGSGSSSYHGKNDRVSAADSAQWQDSLRLVRPQNFKIKVEITGAEFDNPKRAMKALFNFGDTWYEVKVTDPAFNSQINEYEVGVDYLINDAIVCVSLGDAYKGYHYKLIASIFQKGTINP